MNGPTGLDYGPLFTLLDRRYQSDDWDRMFHDVVIIERAALAAMRENQQNA